MASTSKASTGKVVDQGRQALAEAEQKAETFLEELNRKVKLRTSPNVLLRLRKKLNVTALQFTVGTDVTLRDRINGFSYTPNLHMEAHDRLLGGDIRLNTKLNQVSYTKKYDVQSVTLGVSAIYDYNTHTPFTVESTPGVSSSVKSNGFSINHSFETELLDPVRTKVDLLGTVEMPGTIYNAATNSIGLNGPILVDLHDVYVTATI